MEKKFLSDWKVHAICAVFVIIAEIIGIFKVTLGPISFSLLPMLYVLVFGIICAITKVISRDTMETASPYIGIATMWLIAKLSSSIGPNIKAIIDAGPALILQELGNLGTIFLSVPIAIFVFKMGRQAVGAGFSNSREGSIALVGSIYGLDSPEGQGVMGAYITGTILGTIFCGLMASVIAGFEIFHPFSLAMAAGTGSASMMAAGMAPLVERYPDMADGISSYAATSNLLSTVDGLYMSLFIGIPLTNWLYKVLKGDEIHQKAMAQKAAKKGKSTDDFVAEAPKAPVKMSLKETWMTRGKVFFFSGVFALIANWLNTYKAFSAADPATNPAPPVTFIDGLPAMLLMLIPVVLGCLIDDLLKAKTKINAPTILYISIVGMIMSLPQFPIGTLFVTEVNKIGLLPLCTPILAYAGISVGKDLNGFKQQGVGIVCTALMAFIGTYIGSAIIAEIVLRITGVI